MKRWYVIGPLAGVAVGVVAFFFGVQGWRPILMGVVVGAFIIWAPRSWPEGLHLPWPRVGTRVYSGGSQQVSRLSSALAQADGRARRLPPRHPTSSSGFSQLQRSRSRDFSDPGLQHRLRRLAITKLHRLGVSWDDARAPELLGHGVYAALMTDTFTPDLPGVERIVAAIENLDNRTPRVEPPAEATP